MLELIIGLVVETVVVSVLLEAALLVEIDEDRSELLYSCQCIPD